MKTKQQFAACAELDKIYNISHDGKSYCPHGCDISNQANYEPLPNYSSRDVLIPLIEKQPYPVRQKMIDQFIDDDRTFGSIWSFAIASPAQLREALLRATGKWERITMKTLERINLCQNSR